eukprot:gene32269-16835_t
MRSGGMPRGAPTRPPPPPTPTPSLSRRPSLPIPHEAPRRDALPRGVVRAEQLAGSWRLVYSSGFNTGKAEQLAGSWRLVYSSGFNTGKFWEGTLQAVAIHPVPWEGAAQAPPSLVPATPGSLGGRRPGPPPSLVPATLGQVYQRISPETGHLDNIVEFMFSLTPPFPISLLMGQKGEKEKEKETPTARLTLRHDYEILGGNVVQISFEQTLAELIGSNLFAALPMLTLNLQPKTVPLNSNAIPSQIALEQALAELIGANLFAALPKLSLDPEPKTLPLQLIIFEQTLAELVGSNLFAALPKLTLPELPEPLKPPKGLRAATFDVTYLDNMMRITRGDRGELRIFVKDSSMDPVSEPFMDKPRPSSTPPSDSSLVDRNVQVGRFAPFVPPGRAPPENASYKNNIDPEQRDSFPPGGRKSQSSAGNKRGSATQPPPALKDRGADRRRNPKGQKT